MKTNVKIQETGRSMIEMLGVLAIIGVLSVGGIAGYTTAMNKHRANEILNAASVRAVVVSTKLQQNSTADITNALAEFGNETIAGASFTAVSASGNTFTLTLSGVSSEACAQLKNIVGENGNVNINEECTTFTYNADLSAPVTMIPTSTPVSCTSGGGECSGCQTCQDGVCKDNNASCGTDGVCTNGRCTNCPKGDMCGTQCCADGTYCAQDGSCVAPDGTNSCVKNSDCAADGSEYCKFVSGDYCGAPKNGTCTSKGALPSGISYNGHTFYVGDMMNWWSAENFCLAHGKHLANLSSLGLSKNYSYITPSCSIGDPGCRVNPGCKASICTTDDTDSECIEKGCAAVGSPGPLYQAGLNENYWTSNSYTGDICLACYVQVYSDLEYVSGYARSDDYNSALCE